MTTYAKAAHVTFQQNKNYFKHDEYHDAHGDKVIFPPLIKLKPQTEKLKLFKSVLITTWLPCFVLVSVLTMFWFIISILINWSYNHQNTISTNCTLNFKGSIKCTTSIFIIFVVLLLLLFALMLLLLLAITSWSSLIAATIVLSFSVCTNTNTSSVCPCSTCDFDND